MKRFAVPAMAIAALLFAAAADASEWPHERPVRIFAENQVRNWVGEPAVVEAVRLQNEVSIKLTKADIDALDRQWRAEREQSDRPLIDDVLSRPLSAFLAGLQDDSDGIVTEIFVMDNRGLNVGQSQVTSDLWQGDEAKWQETYLVGPDAMLIGGIEYDESTRKWQSQLSLPIVDPVDGSVIGAITVGIDLAAMERITGCPITDPDC